MRGGGGGGGGGGGRSAVYNSDDIRAKLYDREMYRKLLQYVKPYRFMIMISFVLLLIGAALTLVIPLITMTAIDRYVVSDISLLTFSDSLSTPGALSFDDFMARYRKQKFRFAEGNGTRYVILPTKKRNYIRKPDMALLTRQGALAPGKYCLVPDRPEHRGILVGAGYREGVDYHLLANGSIAIQNDRVSLLSRDNRLTRQQILTLKSDAIHRLKRYGLLFFLAIALSVFVQYFQLYVINYAAQNAMFDLRYDVFRHVQRMPLQFFDRNPVGRLVTRVTTDIRALDEMLSAGVVNMMQDVVTLAGIIGMMFFLNVKLAAVTMVILPFVLVYMKLFKDRTRVIYREIRKQLAAINTTISEDIQGIRIIQLFNQYRRKVGQFADTNRLYYQAGMGQMKMFAVFRPVTEVMRLVALAIVLWYGGGQVIHSIISIGMLMAFFRYLDRFFDPINDISEKFNVLQGAMAGAERVFDLMEQKEQDYREDKTTGVRFKGEVEFRNVWLSYLDNDEYALRNVSFKAAPGEKIALVGHTGSGKTSIVSLLTDMYPHQKGEILIDGKPLPEYALSDIRGNIGIVQQDVFLFWGDIRDNIALNDSTIDNDRLEEVARHVNVHEFVDSLPGKYHEPVTERGSTFSVGQRQLISFARVLAYDPAIFILDEATSNIDTNTELVIQDALAKVMAGRTSLIIAHRLSTIKHADRIIVLHKGEIVEEGSHNELISRRGLYYDLYRLQFENPSGEGDN
jgi:ATP-binding cassette, subfamily B, multidrug efflux pump